MRIFVASIVTPGLLAAVSACSDAKAAPSIPGEFVGTWADRSIDCQSPDDHSRIAITPTGFSQGEVDASLVSFPKRDDRTITAEFVFMDEAETRHNEAWTLFDRGFRLRVVTFPGAGAPGGEPFTAEFVRCPAEPAR